MRKKKKKKKRKKKHKKKKKKKKKKKQFFFLNFTIGVVRVIFCNHHLFAYKKINFCKNVLKIVKEILVFNFSNIFLLM